MKETSAENKIAFINEGELDFIALLKIVWEGRRTIYYCIGVFLTLGIILGLLSPPKYSSYAKVLPETVSEEGGLGGLGALAGMAGVNLNSMLSQSNVIQPDLYPQIVNSYPFINEFVHKEYLYEDYNVPISIYDYIQNDTIGSWFNTFLDYTIKLPWTIKDALTKNSPINDFSVDHNFELITITEEEEEVLNYIDDIFEIKVDDETGVVTISVEAKEPILAAQFVKNAMDMLEDYIIEYKTKQVRNNLEFVQERFNETKIEYEQIQDKFFSFKDAHRNFVSERVDVEYQRLSDSYDIINAIYKNLAQQLEQAKIAVKERTPVITVIEPPIVSREPSSPRKKIIAVVAMFLGGFLGVFIVLGKELYIYVKAKF